MSDPPPLSVPALPPELSLLRRWLESKQRKACVPTTLRRYEREVDRVLIALRGEGRVADPTRWTVEDALRIREIRHQDPWSLSIIADFTRFAGSRVFEEVGIPPVPPRRHVRWLSREEVAAILEATRDDPLLSFVALLGLGQGMRRVEWKRLRVEDVDLVHRRLLIRGKGRATPKLAFAPLHPAFPSVFSRFLAYRDQVIRDAQLRFPGSNVPPEALLMPSKLAHGLHAYTNAGIDRLVRSIERKVREGGREVHLSTHMFRRSGATLLEETLLNSPQASRDGVYRTVQEFLRHENLATTMKYLESSPRRQRKAFDQYARVFPWPAPP
ncbi:MAG: site-specific integrase [Euryarchaeota archaeon]|nr:site-specific integrase [Euryarchaeota archaeon]MDE1837929.1 site-specific integrase [Euryarchaeota archaeon]MDE1880173.1 site-specific integrase [Euryarchaeota archaeon]MDE2045390.1 site-specific integrase [Thermoplasmata archaeon]